jgi:hypothetical protein
MKIELTNQQIESIVKSELESRLAIADDARQKMALEIVLESFEGDSDELQGIVATTAC